MTFLEIAVLIFSLISLVTIIILRLKLDKANMLKVRYPVAFHTVDIAIIAKVAAEYYVLLISKSATDIKWRFPSGFVDTTDWSAERAACREAKEETGLHLTGISAEYLGSTKINDPRYIGTPHGILTSFYMLNIGGGGMDPILLDENLVALDDAKLMRWFKLSDIIFGEKDYVSLDGTTQVKMKGSFQAGDWYADTAKLHRPLFEILLDKFSMTGGRNSKI